MAEAFISQIEAAAVDAEASVRSRWTSTRASSSRHRASLALAQATTTAATGDVLVFAHPSCSGVTAETLNAALPGQSGVRVLATETLDGSTTLHAEADATQMSAHYLLPLNWLDGGAEAAAWAVEHAQAPVQSARAGRRSVAIGAEAKDATHKHTSRAARPPPPPAIVRLKQALRAAENATPCKPSSGRYGRLAEKGKVCWSAFAEPSLEGLAR